MRQINWVTALFLLLTPVAALVWGGVYVRLSGVHAERPRGELQLLTAPGS